MGVRAIEKCGQHREAAQIPDQKEAIMTATDDPEVLRKEILVTLNKISDRGSLLFFQSLLRRIHANAPIPGNDELRALHEAMWRSA
jgi:hypothetical protein